MKIGSFSYTVTPVWKQQLAVFILTMSFAELSKFGMDIPAVGSPVYVVTIQKRWHKPEKPPYKVYEYCYCDDYLKDYELPEFMKKE